MRQELIGERIRRLRLDKGLYQHELAAKVRCAQRTICNVENGKFGANMFTFIEIAKVLGVSLDYLAYGDKDNGND